MRHCCENLITKFNLALLFGHPIQGTSSRACVYITHTHTHTHTQTHERSNSMLLWTHSRSLFLEPVWQFSLPVNLTYVQVAGRDVGLQTNLQSPKETTKFNNGILALFGSKFHFENIHSVCLSRYSFIKPTTRKSQTYVKVRSFTTAIFFGHPQGVHTPKSKPVGI